MSAISIPMSFYCFKTFGNPDNLTTAHPLSILTVLGLIFLTFINTLASALVYGPMGVYVMEFFRAEPAIQAWVLHTISAMV